MAVTTYTKNGLSSLSGTFSNTSVVNINLDASAGVNTWKIYLNAIPHNDNVILYGGLYDAYNGGGNRMINVDSTVMSLYNNDVGVIESNRNYIRYVYYNMGNNTYEGMHLSLELHNCNLSYTVRDTSSSRDEMARTVRGTWLAGKQYITNYQMTDVGSFMGSNSYTSSLFPTGVESISFYMNSGNMSGNYKAVPVLRESG